MNQAMDGVSDSTETTSTASTTTTTTATTDNEQRVYFVPYRWWRDANVSTSTDSGILYTARPGASYMKIINNIFNSDIVFNLSKQEDDNAEVGVSGRDYALVPGDKWLDALKWHSNAKAATKNGKSFSVGEDDMADVYPLQLRLSVLQQVNSLGVKISKKDNAIELFRRACKIFSIDSDLLRIWDFSGQTTLFLTNDKSKSPKDFQRQSDQDVLLELQIYGISDSIKNREGKKDEMAIQYSNGFFGRNGEAGCLGLTGLQNLGNTCFMNSALQCLAHTPKLVDYFLGDYGREINPDNPLGMEGEIALVFGELIRKLWAPGASPVAPRTFKSKLARFAPQFSGFNQHDSQELLAFLLDGLHEDLNRVKSKPYVEAKDGDGRSDEDIADEYWQNHVARNDSIIVDVCQGQYKSTLVCPVCKKVSVTFDPFMYLSLPLPSTSMRTMTLTVVSTNGTTHLSSYTVTVPKHGKFEDLIKALSAACSLEVDECLLVAEIYNYRIIRYLEEPADSLSLIRDEDRLVAYRLRKDVERDPLVIFMHQQMEEQCINGKSPSNLKALGIPLVVKVSNLVNGLDISNLYSELLSSFRLPAKDIMDGNSISESTATEEVARTDDTISLTTDYEDATVVDGKAVESPSDAELQFYISDEKGITKDVKIIENEPVTVTGDTGRLYVLVCWSEKQIQQYDTRLLSSLPEISKSSFLTKRPQESVSLYKCLEAFLTEEPLGPDDMWYCPGCKEHRQASKKLDLWRLPEILVIHLKRFSYSRFLKNKLETYVDFPVEDLDLSTYVAYKNGQTLHRYTLYAISNHYGSMGGGHYTACVHHGGDQWYDFDDSHVHPISQEKIKTSAAYVLFYRRVVEA